MGFKIKKTVNGETVWEPIKAKKYTASKITEHTGALPITINANGQPLLDYRIYGNTVQTGTPTPENPIMPSGCGERTENLFDINSLYSTVVVQGQTFTKPASAYFFDVFSGSSGGSAPMNLQKSIPVTGGTYTLSFEESETKIAVVFSDGETQTVITGSSSVTPRTFDVTSDGYVSIRCENPNVCSIKKLQIVKASTAPTSYIPYGYKLPMTVSDGNTVQTIPVYIGKSQLVESEYVSYSEGKIYRKNPANYFDGYFELGAIDHNTGAEVPAYSSLRTDFIELEPSNKFYFKWATGYFYIVPFSYDENKDFVRYLGAKSTNPSNFNLGANEKYIRFYLYNTTTPPKEMMVCKNANAPYYDPQDPPVPLPQIPTIKGETVIDYDGTPKPSQMYVKYNSWSGWSDINNYKMVNGDWTQEMI